MTLRYVISIVITAIHALLGCVFAFILLVLGYPAIWVQIMLWQNLTLSGVVFAALALWPWRTSPPDSAAAPDNAAAPNSPEAPGNPGRTLRAQEGGEG